MFLRSYEITTNRQFQWRRSFTANWLRTVHIKMESFGGTSNEDEVKFIFVLTSHNCQPINNV